MNSKPKLHRWHFERVQNESCSLVPARAMRSGRISDIDLAVFGLPHQMEGIFLDGIEELPTLLKFDVVLIDDRTSADLLDVVT